MSPDLSALRDRCNAQLPLLLGEGFSEFSDSAAPLLQRLHVASEYALTSGGKRIRALLLYASAFASGSTRLDDPALDYAACSLEMIHAYSLVHDDLPAMDDDDLRRGKPTCHRAFDEATAVLVGDALQARAFELLVIAPGLDAATRVELVRILATASGARGMVGGQAIDVEAAGREIQLDHLEAMHALKTGALIQAATQIGATIAAATPAQKTLLNEFACTIGLAFQVHDDVLDVDGDSNTLGKQQGADAARNKPTYVKLLGLEGAQAKARELSERALTLLEPLGNKADLLQEITRYITARNY